MKQELLSVDCGKLTIKGNVIFDGLYLHVFRNEIAGIICDDIQTIRCLNEFLLGEMALDSGRLFVDEKRIPASGSQKAVSGMSALIDMKSKLVESITVEENVFFFSDPSFFIHDKEYGERFQTLQKALGIQIVSGLKPSALSSAERILVELMRAYVGEKSLVILDDISGYLQKNELEEIFSVLLKLNELGMTFLVRIGFEDEYLQNISRITAVKNKKTVSVIEPDKTDFPAFVRRLYFNEKTIKLNTQKKVSNFRKKVDCPVLEFRDVVFSALNNINFSVGRGELLTIHCYDDRSCSQIADLLKGEIKPISGSVFYLGSLYQAKNISSAIHQGICFLEERACDTMLFYNMSVVENLGIPCNEKVRRFWAVPRYSESIARQIKKKIGNISVNTPLRGQRSSVLLQIAYYKWLLYFPKVVVCVNPFTDVDIYMREKAIDMIHQYLERGIAVVIVTSNYYTAGKFEGKTINISKGKQLTGFDDS